MKPASKAKRKARPAEKKSPGRARASTPSARSKNKAARASTLGAASQPARQLAKPRLAKRRPPAKAPLARAVAWSTDDRQALALLMLPFLLMATGIGVSQSIRNFPGHAAVAEIHAPAPETVSQEASLRRSLSSMPRTDVPPAAVVLPVLPLVPAATMAALQPPQPPELVARDAATGDRDASGRVCMAAVKAPAASQAPGGSGATADPAEFGLRLAAAARAQIGDLVIYNDRYRHISYPMGDVAPLFGVCTDVVVRAYRALGLDLQSLVHLARVGSGDTNIDHRRTEVLRRYFSAYGETLPITQFAEDYLPGDIVTYYRPQNRHSRSHIAVVSDVIAPSGRPMIIHNRGWGPQLEDALFVDQITGHYRYAGVKLPGGARREWAHNAPATKSGSTPENPRAVQAAFGVGMAPDRSVARPGGASPATSQLGRF